MASDWLRDMPVGVLSSSSSSYASMSNEVDNNNNIGSSEPSAQQRSSHFVENLNDNIEELNTHDDGWTLPTRTAISSVVLDGDELDLTTVAPDSATVSVNPTAVLETDGLRHSRSLRRPQPNQRIASPSSNKSKHTAKSQKTLESNRDRQLARILWVWYCRLVTLPAISPLLNLFKIKGRPSQDAWREKMGLLSVITFLTAFVAFFTFGFNSVVCGPNPAPRIHYKDLVSAKNNNKFVVLHGKAVNTSLLDSEDQNLIQKFGASTSSVDISLLFQNINGNCKDHILATAHSTVPRDQYGNVSYYFPCSLVSIETGEFIHDKMAKKNQFVKRQEDRVSILPVPGKPEPSIPQRLLGDVLSPIGLDSPPVPPPPPGQPLTSLISTQANLDVVEGPPLSQSIELSLPTAVLTSVVPAIDALALAKPSTLSPPVPVDPIVVQFDPELTASPLTGLSSGPELTAIPLTSQSVGTELTPQPSAHLAGPDVTPPAPLDNGDNQGLLISLTVTASPEPTPSLPGEPVLATIEVSPQLVPPLESLLSTVETTTIPIGSSLPSDPAQLTTEPSLPSDPVQPITTEPPLPSSNSEVKTAETLEDPANLATPLQHPPQMPIMPLSHNLEYGDNAPSYNAAFCHLLDSQRATVYSLRNIPDIYYTWQDVASETEIYSRNLVVYGGDVIDLDRLALFPYQDWQFSHAFQHIINMRVSTPDMTLVAGRNKLNRQAVQCLVQVAKIGVVDAESVGCLMSHIVLYISLAFIFSIVAIKFFLAVYFEWFVSWRLSEPLWQNEGTEKTPQASNTKMNVICLVTAYSEDKAGIQTTLDSIVETNYPNSNKLIFVVCDGLVTGKDNTERTCDMVLSLLQPLSSIQAVDKYTCDHLYFSVGTGKHRCNRAKVYLGYYAQEQQATTPFHNVQQRRVPMIVVVKTGLGEEQDTAKPGNRGKRDSQVLLMRFFQKILYREPKNSIDRALFDAMLDLDFDPYSFEAVLMVDADTKIYTSSLRRMVATLLKDERVMGLCGETKIANKRDSWVSQIQVFEYFISHHLTKAFESVFGGVTCLPGCFAMYRLQHRDIVPNVSVPLLADEDIVNRYALTDTDTVHDKNLLLLGEDRYLSTLMLRRFPRRKQVFVPQAKCKTTVPNTFMVLLNQRRRWINSTIHNLLELVLVRNLCGVFCFSMQFVVAIELVGTVTLPAAFSFTIYMLAMCFYQSPPPLIPLALLLMIIGAPGILILVTAHKWMYAVWMLVYLMSLPVWNFVLPLYAFWHFDDFTWGTTRQVA